MILLGTIEDFFTISGRGTVIASAFSDGLEPNFKFYVGDEIQLHSADSLSLNTKIKGIEFLKRIKPGPLGTNMGILLSKDIDPRGLSKGMEIWLVRDEGRNG